MLLDPNPICTAPLASKYHAFPRIPSVPIVMSPIIEENDCGVFILIPSK